MGYTTVEPKIQNKTQHRTDCLTLRQIVHEINVVQMWTSIVGLRGIYTAANFEAVQFQNNVVEGFHMLHIFQKTFMEICCRP